MDQTLQGRGQLFAFAMDAQGVPAAGENPEKGWMRILDVQFAAPCVARLSMHAGAAPWESRVKIGGGGGGPVRTDAWAVVDGDLEISGIGFYVEMRAANGVRLQASLAPLTWPPVSPPSSVVEHL